jgi:hypothetical protein
MQMEWIEIEGKQVPLLEPPETHKEIPRRILQVLFKYKRLIRNVFLAVSLPLLLIVLLAPEQYMATVKVLIKPSRAFLGLTPTGTDSSVTVPASMEALMTEIQLIKSREVLVQLAKELPFPDSGLLASGSPSRELGQYQSGVGSEGGESGGRTLSGTKSQSSANSRHRKILRRTGSAFANRLAQGRTGSQGFSAA